MRPIQYDEVAHARLQRQYIRQQVLRQHAQLMARRRRKQIADDVLAGIALFGLMAVIFSAAIALGW